MIKVANAPKIHSDAFVFKRKTLQDIVETLRLAGVLLESDYRAAFIFYEFFDERHDSIHNS